MAQQETKKSEQVPVSGTDEGVRESHDAGVTKPTCETDVKEG